MLESRLGCCPGPSGQGRGADQGGGLERDDQVVEVPIASPVEVFESKDVVPQHLEVLDPIGIGLVERKEGVPCRAGLHVREGREHEGVRHGDGSGGCAVVVGEECGEIAHLAGPGGRLVTRLVRQDRLTGDRVGHRTAGVEHPVEAHL